MKAPNRTGGKRDQDIRNFYGLAGFVPAELGDGEIPSINHLDTSSFVILVPLSYSIVEQCKIVNFSTHFEAQKTHRINIFNAKSTYEMLWN